MFILVDRDSAKGIQTQVYDQIRAQILNGILKPGASIASSRHLSEELRISRNSVVFAYERLISEGYIVTRPKIGTFVASHIPEKIMLAEAPEDPDGEAAAVEKLPAATFSGRQHSILSTRRIPVDFWPQRTDPRAFPLKTWRRHIVHCLATAAHNLTEYGEPCGLMALRSAIAEHVAKTRNIHVSAEQVVIVTGAQFGLNLVMRILAREGDPIVVENPCNQGAAYLFESLGLKTLPMDVDVNGINTAHLLEIDARMIHVMPSHHYPMGVTLALSRRKKIVKWAADNGVYIIEDDYDNEFTYEGSTLPALTALSPDNSIYLGTFSKSLGAGLRTGYVIFPSHLVPAASAAKALLDNGQAWLEQRALAEFIHGGGFMRHLRRSRIRYLSRRNALVSAMKAHFPSCTLWGEGGGTHLAWRVSEEFGTSHFLMAAAQSRNIGVYTLQSAGGHEYGDTKFYDRWLLLGFASLTEEQITAGVNRLARIIHG